MKLTYYEIKCLNKKNNLCFSEARKNEDWSADWAKYSVERALRWNIGYDNLKIYDKYLSKNAKILEAGCGLGQIVIHYHKRGYNITGIDNSEVAIKKIKAYDPSVAVENGDLSLLPYQDNHFDAYLSLGVVEHFFPFPRKILSEAHRVLKHNGLIMIDVPIENAIRRFFKPLRRLRQLNTVRRLFGHGHIEEKEFYYIMYKKGEFKEFIEKAGFEIIEVIPTMHSWGLIRAFSFLKGGDKDRRDEDCLNSLGKFIYSALRDRFPWLFPFMCMIVASKKQ